MSRRALAFMLLSLVLTAGSGFCADTSYKVKLGNGNVLEANSYRIKDGKVYLKYPMGEAAISASEILSITAGDGTVEFLQSQGVASPKPKEEAPRKQVVEKAPAQEPVPALPPVGVAGRENRLRHAPARPKENKEARAARVRGNSDKDPQVDSLFEKNYDLDDPKSAAEYEKEMNALFTDEALGIVEEKTVETQN